MNKRNWTPAQIDEMDTHHYFELLRYQGEINKPGARIKQAKRQGNLTPINHVF
jgi:hypothetical protein